MFNLTFKNTITSTLAVAIVATSVSVTPSFAGGDGGGGRKENVSTISTTNPDGSTTSIRSHNRLKWFTVKRTKNGKVVSKKRVNKKPGAFITIHNPDGTSRTVNKPRKPGKDFVTLHNADGTSHTINKPSKPGKAFITVHNPDGTSTTVGDR